MAFWKQIKILHFKHPLAVQGLIGATIQVTTDLTDQKLLEESEKLDLRRCRNSFVLGWLTGLVLGGWYRYLDVNISTSRKFTKVLYKVAADQLIFARAFVTIASMDCQDLLPKPMLKIRNDESKNFPSLLIISHKLWPTIQAINFYFVPIKYQVAFNCTCAAAWNFLASNCKHEKVQDNVDESFGDWLLKSAGN